MTTIYEPRGRAGEYSLLGLNLYRGCTNNCYYCYVPQQIKIKAEEFHGKSIPRKNVLDHLARNAKYFAGTDRRVLLSFTSDPYNTTEKTEKVTQTALGILRHWNIPFQILTKNAMLARRDFGLYRLGDAFAVTLTSTREKDSQKWEPGTDSPSERMHALYDAYRRGIFTWVSLEPVVDIGASLDIIRLTREYVNHYKIGTLNHVDCKTTPNQWRQFAKRAVNLCTAYRRTYYLKKDLVCHVDFDYTNTDERRLPVACLPEDRA